MELPTTAVVLTLIALSLVLAPRAEAYIYWTVEHSIGRANLNGTGVNEDFARLGCPPLRDCESPHGLAIDAGHIYWAYFGYPTGGLVGRANLDGTRVDHGFIHTEDWLGGPDVAADAEHVYWTALYPPSSAIARANLDGTAVEVPFLPTSAAYLAVDPRHIYWSSSGAIGRANLDGTGVDESFITSVEPGDIAVDDAHVYWSNHSSAAGGTIGRANLDGSGVDKGFITSVEPGDIALDASHIYWNNGGSIARAELDGGAVEPDFIPGNDHVSIAVDALKPPGAATAKQVQKQKGRRIRLAIKVRAKEKLIAQATGQITVNHTSKLKPRTVAVVAGATKTLRLRPRRAQARRIAAALKRGERATATITVKLSGRTGNSATEKLRVRLKR